MAVIIWLILGVLTDLLAHMVTPSLIMVTALGMSIMAGALGLLVGRPSWTALMIIVATWSLWLSPMSGIDRWLLPLIEALLGGMISWWSRSAIIGRLEPRDGFFGFILLILVSAALSVALLLHPVPLSNHLFLLLAAYLLTPPTEVFIVLMILTRHQVTRSYLAQNYQWNQHGLSLIGIGIVIGLALSFATALFVEWEAKLADVRIRSNNPFVYAHGLHHHVGIIGSLMIIAIVIMAPLAEEILFRGILFGTLWPAWGLTWAVVVAGIIFGAAHMNLTLLLPLALAGMSLNWVYFKTRSLIPSTVAHATLNFLSVLVAILSFR